MKSSHRFDPKLSQREMLEAAQMGPGKKVRVKHHHRGAKDGEHGEVREVHRGVYYGIGFGDGPLAYVPADHCEPVQSGDSGGSTEATTTSTSSGSGGGTGAGAGTGPVTTV